MLTNELLLDHIEMVAMALNCLRLYKTHKRRKVVRGEAGIPVEAVKGQQNYKQFLVYIINISFSCKNDYFYDLRVLNA